LLEWRLSVSTKKVQRPVSYLGTEFPWIYFLQAYAEIVAKFEVATAGFSCNSPDLNSSQTPYFKLHQTSLSPNYAF
jgi:hypothetical protein